MTFFFFTKKIFIKLSLVLMLKQILKTAEFFFLIFLLRFGNFFFVTILFFEVELSELAWSINDFG